MLKDFLGATGIVHLKLACGETVVEIVHEVFGGVACYGASLTENKGIDELGATLEEALSAGLTLAEKELGRKLDRPAIPIVLGGVVGNLLRGELTNVDPKSENFRNYSTNCYPATA